MEQPSLNILKKIAENDTDFQKQMIIVLKKEFPQEQMYYRLAMKLNDLSLAAQHVHKLKHKIGLFGLEKSYEIATAYETQLNTQSTTLQSDFEIILQRVSQYINQL